MTESALIELYRYEVVQYAPPPEDELGGWVGPGRFEIHLRVYPVLKQTPCGAWIVVYGERRFVNLKARKQFACNTKQAAREAFIARKRRQVSILSSQLSKVREILSVFLGQKGFLS